MQFAINVFIGVHRVPRNLSLRLWQ